MIVLTNRTYFSVVYFCNELCNCLGMRRILQQVNPFITTVESKITGNFTRQFVQSEHFQPLLFISKEKFTNAILSFVFKAGLNVNGILLY